MIISREEFVKEVFLFTFGAFLFGLSFNLGVLGVFCPL